MFEDQIAMVAAIREKHADKFVYQQPQTPLKLIEEITASVGAAKTARVLVMFTVEWALYLSHNGYENVVVCSDNDATIEGLCKMLGLKYCNISEINNNKMKFDVVVGNPPYQNGKNKLFYRSFVSKSFALAPIVAMITPASWNSAGMTPFKKQVIKAGLYYYSYLGTTAFENSQNDVCAFICNKANKHKDMTIVNGKETIQIIDLESHGFIPHVANGAVDILVKTSRTAGIEKMYVRGVINPEKFSAGNIKTVLRNGFSNEPTVDVEIAYNNAVGVGLHKVVVAYNSSIGNLGPAKYKNPEYAIGYAVAMLVCKSEEECNNLIHYLNTKFVKFIIKNTKTSIQNSKSMFERIPKIDFTRQWTDAELYKHFNLTQEEIDLIESTVK